MRRLLHILTQAEDPLAEELIAEQRNQAALEVEVVNLTVAEPDYPALLDSIFAADSVTVW